MVCKLTTLEIQKKLLGPIRTRIATKGTVISNDSMTRKEHRERIGADSVGYRPDSSRSSEHSGQSRIGNHLAARDIQQGVPYFPLKSGAESIFHRKTDQSPAVATKISIESTDSTTYYLILTVLRLQFYLSRTTPADPTSRYNSRRRSHKHHLSRRREINRPYKSHIIWNFQAPNTPQPRLPPHLMNRHHAS